MLLAPGREMIILALLATFVTFAGSPAEAGSAGDLKARVPPEQLLEAKSLRNPY